MVYMKKVFVYGSLLSGLGNHGLLSESKLVGITKTPKSFNMLDLGSFPGVIEEREGKAIIGEVYEVDDMTFNRLDQLEGYNKNNPTRGLYDRMIIETEFGEAYMYTYNNHYGGGDNIVEDGDWRKYYTNKYNR